MKTPPLSLVLVLLCAACSSSPAPTAAPPTERAAAIPADWPTYTDPQHHFDFRYPPAWAINPESTLAFHYKQILASVNSLGQQHLTLKEVQTAPDTWESTPATVGSLLPAGAAYLDVAWWEGPGPLPIIGPN